ncbi:MAG: YIP1 family protein [bacterium]|nr:YIP1 family protein [bacterium]
MEDNSFGRIASVLISPTRTFRSIADRPTWLVALLVLLAVSLVSTIVAAPKIDWEQAVRADLEKSGREIPAEQLETSIEIMEKFGTTIMYVAVLVFPWIVYPLMAGIFFGLLRILGSELPFKTSLAVTVYGFMPWLVATVLNIPVFMGRAEITAEELQNGALMSHLGAFAGADAGKVLTTLLSSIDFFSFWAIILLTIGFSIAAKVSRGRAAMCVVGVWLVYVVGKVGLTALGQMAGG